MKIDERAIGRGSRFLQTLAVGGLGELTLNDVDFQVDFYAKEKRDSKVNGIYTVHKSDVGYAFPDSDDDNIYYVICDTSNLDTGDLYASVILEYTDENTNAQIKEIIPIECDRIVVDVPKAPVVVSHVVESVVDDAQELTDIDGKPLPLFAIVQGDTNLWKYMSRSGSNSWDDDGPDVSEGMKVVLDTNNHVYVADVNGVWEDLGAVPFVIKN